MTTPTFKLRPGPLDNDGKRRWIATITAPGIIEYGATSEFPVAAIANLARKLALVVVEQAATIDNIQQRNEALAEYFGATLGGSATPPESADEASRPRPGISPESRPSGH